MYAISNAAALLVAVWQYGVSAINLKKIAFTFLLLQGGGLDNGSPYNSPTWFVSALFFCYILYYTGTRWAKSYTGYCVFLAAGIAAGYYFSITEGSLPFCFSGNGVGYLNFFLGCALAELYALLEKRNIHLKVATLTMLLVSLYLMLRYGVEIISGDSTTAFAFVISPFVIYLAYDRGGISYILNWKILQYLGKISMGVFYWHLVIYIAVRYAFGGMSVKIYGLYLLTVLLVAALTESFRKKNA